MLCVQLSEPPAKRVTLSLYSGNGTLGQRRGRLVAHNLITPRRAFKIPFPECKVKVGGVLCKKLRPSAYPLRFVAVPANR